MSEKSNKNKKELSDNKSKQPLLNILMLHGYRQSESVFRERSGGLRKYLKNHAEFTFCEAPHNIPDNPTEESFKEETEKLENGKGWWFSTSDQTYNALETTDCDRGFKETLDYLNNVFKLKGPFDGIFGFSQGGCLAGILSKIATENDSNYEFIRFKFAIIVAGFKSNQNQHSNYYDLNNKINLPTLHVIGNGDKVIPNNLGTDLTNYFLEPKIFYHEAGHFIPVNAESKAAFLDFLSMVKEKLSI